MKSIKNRKIMQNKYLSCLEKKVVIFDGGMGTSLEKLNLSAKHFGGKEYIGCNDLLNINYPEAVLTVHKSFLKVGVDVIETNTFRANKITLKEFGLEAKVAEINMKGAQIAKKAANEFSTKDKPRFVAGSMGPTGRLLSIQIEERNSTSESFDEIRDVYSEQAYNLIMGGVDLLLVETAQDILEVKSAIHGIHNAFDQTGKKLPIQVQVTLDTNGRMLFGTDIDAVLAILEGMNIDILGLNCSTGPEHMEHAIAYLSRHSHLPISCLPNAGLPVNKNGKAIYPLSPKEFSNEMLSFINKYKLSIAGGCCGTTPEHLLLLVENTKSIPQVKRGIHNKPSLSSPFHVKHLKQEPAPLIIGERLNTQGSRFFKNLMLVNDFEGALKVGKEQLASGAHALDICTALTEDTNESERMVKLIKLLSKQIDLPLVIDSTDFNVMNAALKVAPGRCLLNSVNLENGEAKANQLLSLAKTFNAAIIGLTIDEKGMAATANRKLAVAKRIYELAVNNFGLSPQSLVFDPLTFTLASGSNETIEAGIQTLKALQLIKKEYPDSFTILGVSNISFGLNPEARRILNSVFLTHAVRAGLDLAILNPAQITPYTAIPDEAKQLAENLIYNRNSKALEQFIDYFHVSKKKVGEHKPQITKQLTPEEQISQHILLRIQENLESNIDAYINADNNSSKHEKAMEVLNNILLPAMQEIGNQFGNGDLILPFVLQSAEIMRTATDHLESYLEKSAVYSKGKMVIATVYGDVHDIGKNLIKTIVSNNGYSVIDLGKQVPAETIIKKAKELNADAIGLSALLVSTSQQMPIVIRQLHKNGEDIPVLIGGAAVNNEFAKRISFVEDGRTYPGGVFYCKDAFDALNILSNIGKMKK